MILFLVSLLGDNIGVTVHVADENDVSLEQVKVSAFLKEEESTSDTPYTGSTDASGNIVLDLPTGEYNFIAHDDLGLYGEATIDFNITAEFEDQINITMTENEGA